jgi:hypothetical protein
MAAATNQQMQNYADQRMRPRAEQFRNLRIACLDDRSAIDDVYARALSNDRWADERTDGPPHLLQSGSSASPDDVLNYNSFADLFEKFMSGTFANVNEANAAAANWAVLQDACVRPAQVS